MEELSILCLPKEYMVTEKMILGSLKKSKQGDKGMREYLVCNYLPDDFDPSTVTEAMIEEIHALNRELIAAGARKFACGISPAANAKTVRKQPDGKVVVTDGPYTE